MVSEGCALVASRGLPDDAQAEALRRSLPAEEWHWIGRLKRPDDRRRSLTGRALARRLLAARLGTPPERIQLTTGPHGKPQLADETTGWHFNIAHSADLVLVALGRAPLGVDVECTPAAVEPALWNAITRTPPTARTPQAFCAEWVRREAVLKAHGTGLRVDPRGLRFATPADGGWQRVLGLSSAAHAPTLCVRLLWQAGTDSAALCTSQPAPAWPLVRVALAQWADPACQAAAGFIYS